MPQTLLLALEGLVEPFLVKWTRHMDRAGYLAHTTAKKEDCVLSYQAFLRPLWSELRSGRPVGDFTDLLHRQDGWDAAMLAMSERHRARGVTAQMFMGCLKTLVHSVEELLREMDASPGRILAAIDILRRHADAMDTLLVGHWTTLSQQEVMERLDSGNRQLTLQKNKFENIFATTSDFVLVVGADGRIENANRAARAVLDPLRLEQETAWALLDLDASSMAEVLALYPPGAAHEIAIQDGTLFLEMRLSPLSSVSLASSSHLFLLTDITGHVRQRATLERRVRERTAELEQKTTRLEEMNITLRNVLSSIESERRDFQRSVAQAVETTLLPTLKHVQAADDAAVRQGYAGLLGDQLLRLCDGAGGADSRLLSLTPTELKVCQFIQAGSRTKDIADALSLSVETVQTHRKSIRRKLSLSGKEVNLFTYLKAGA